MSRRNIDKTEERGCIYNIPFSFVPFNWKQPVQNPFSVHSKLSNLTNFSLLVGSVNHVALT